MNKQTLTHKITLGLFVSLSTLAITTQSIAGTHHFSGFMPGGQMVTKKIVSIRERKYVNIIRQKTDFSCGAAALATLLKYVFGFNVTENKVIAGLSKITDPKIVRRKGFSLLDLKNYAESFGINGFGVKVKLRHLRQLAVPVIVLLDIKGYSHFVVLKKVDQKFAYLADPALGNHVMEVKAFKKSWNGILLGFLGKSMNKDSVLLKEIKPLSAKALVGIKARMPFSPFTDHGFAHKDYF